MHVACNNEESMQKAVHREKNYLVTKKYSCNLSHCTQETNNSGNHYHTRKYNATKQISHNTRGGYELLRSHEKMKASPWYGDNVVDIIVESIL